MSGPLLEPTLPVVVLQQVAGHFQHGVLGIARSLGRLGVPVHVVHHEPRSPGVMSRYCRGRIISAPPDPPAEVMLERLRAFSDEHGPAILIPTDDDSALLVDERAADLRPAFRFPERPPGLARTLANKQDMALLCAEHDIPTPRVDVPADRDELQSLIPALQFPVMVKSIDGGRLYRRTGERMRIATDVTDLLRAYDELQDPDVPNLLLQEYIPGGPESVWMFNGYFDRDSVCHVGVTGRKLRQLPPYTGVTSLGVCVPNPEVAALTQRFMKAVGYRGVLDIGYRFDARDGKYKLLDVNPRVGATFRLFAGTGDMDVVRALYLDMTGQPIPASQPRWGRKWLVENFDVASSLVYRRDGRLSLRRWAGSLRGVEELGWFAVDDPLPFLSMTSRYALRPFARDRHAPAATVEPAGTGDSVADTAARRVAQSAPAA